MKKMTLKKITSNAAIIILIAVSAVIYLIQFIFFHDIRDTAFYMLQDWAFLPIQIALVTIIAGKIINEHEKAERIEKTRMLAGSFFREVGDELMSDLVPCIENRAELSSILHITPEWGEKDFRLAAEKVKSTSINLNCGPEDFKMAAGLLAEKRLSLLVIAANPDLLEHEEFTDMMWAVFHLSDEFTLRGDPSGLSRADLDHLNSDTCRVAEGLISNWLCSLAYIRKEYPYLFLLEAARNPFSLQ